MRRWYSMHMYAYTFKKVKSNKSKIYMYIYILLLSTKEKEVIHWLFKNKIKTKKNINVFSIALKIIMLLV